MRDSEKTRVTSPDPAQVPELRPTSRVLLLDERDRLLLFQAFPPAGWGNDPEIWVPPGGGLNPGESFEDAARREVWEETGLEAFELGPCVWTRDAVWRWGERLVDSRERFFLGRTSGFEVRPAALEELELETMGEHRWWCLDEILASPELVFVPRALGALLTPLLAGDVPREPIVIGI